MLVRKAREAYNLGAKRIRVVFLRQTMRRWREATLYEKEFEEAGQDLGVLYGLSYVPNIREGRSP